MSNNYTHILCLDESAMLYHRIFLINRDIFPNPKAL